MKKIFLSLSLTLLLFSCNNDIENNEETSMETVARASIETNAIENETDQMFFNYVNSEEHTNFERSLDIFYAKLNLDETDADFRIMTPIEWIRQNLSKTSFKDFESAEIEYRHLIDLKDIELRKFVDVTAFFRNNDVVVTKPYFDKWLTEPMKTAGDYDECQDIFDECNDRADTQYFIDFGKVLATSSGFDTPSLVSQVTVQYKMNLGICLGNFNRCLGIGF